VCKVISCLLFTFLILSFSKDEKEIINQKRDFKILQDLLKSKEGKLDLHISEDSINSVFDKVYSQLEDKKTLIELYKLFSFSVSRLQCGHTDLAISPRLISEWVKEQKSLPLDYVLVGKKLFVNELDKLDLKMFAKGVKNIKNYKSIPKNSEITKIDGKSVDELIHEFGMSISSDEDQWDFRYFKSAQLFEFYRTIYSEKKDSIEVSYIKNKDTSTIYLKLGYPAIRTLFKRIQKFDKEEEKKLKNHGKFSFIKSKYAYFRFLSFRESFGKSYEKFLENSFKDIKRKKVDKLIVDVRGNLGGQLQSLFMSYILGPNVYLGKYKLNKPFKRFTNKRINKLDKNFRIHKKFTKKNRKFTRKYPHYDGEIYTQSINEEYRFNGKIIVVTDEGSFSASSILACHLKTLAKAKIVGQQAGGSFYAGNAGTLKAKLPYTGFHLYVNPNTFYTNLTLREGEDPSYIKKPDFEVVPINPKIKKLEAWYVNNLTKYF
jgi:C-terminal processing protease CtpA/Prc